MTVRHLLLLLYFFSGFSALIYEIAWARMLGLIIGTSVAAWGVICAVYMGGMAAGFWAGGRLADRFSRPLLLFALCELGIGLFGASSPSLLHLARELYVSLVPLFGPAAESTALPRMILAGGLLVIPTMLMGGTLPAISRVFFSPERPFGRDLGIIYSVNTFGAVAGALAAGFVMLPAFGISSSLFLAAVINCAAAAAALLLSCRRCGSCGNTFPCSTATASLPQEMPPWLLPSVLACSGFCAMAFEVLWSRCLVFFMSSTTYAFTTVLSVVLAGLAGGSLAAAAVARNPRSIPVWIAGLQVCIALFGFASPWLLQHIDAVIRLAENNPVYSWSRWLAVRYLAGAFIVFPPALCMGATFPLVTGAAIKSLATAGRSVGSLASLNTLGGIAGALAAAFLLIPSAGVQQSLAIIAFINFACGMAVMALGMKMSLSRVVTGTALAGVLGTVTLLSAGRNPLVLSSRAVREANGPVSLVSYREDQAACVSVMKTGRGRLLNIDGFNAAGTYRYEYMHLLGHLPALLSPSPDTALVICLGSGTTCGCMGLYPEVRHIDCAEISPAVIASASFFSDVNYCFADSEKVRIRCGDGRNHLLAARRRYDVISLEPMHPCLASAAALYSYDFYRLCRKRLSAHGVMAQWAPLHALSPREYRMLIASFIAVFPHASLWFLGTEGVLIGTVDPLMIDPVLLKRKMSAAAPMSDLTKISLTDPARLLSCFIMDEEGLRAYCEGVPVMTDDLPRLEFSAPRNLVLQRQSLWCANAEEIGARRVSPVPLLVSGDRCCVASIRRCAEASSLIMKAGVLQARGKFFEALVTADAALALMPGDTTASMIRDDAAGAHVQVCLNSARGLRGRGMLPQAEQAYFKALAADPLCAPAHTELATLYGALGMLDKELEHSRQAVLASPDDPAVLTNLAVACMNSGRRAEAEKHLLRAAAIDDRYGRAHYFLAELFRETGRGGLAQEALKHARELGYEPRPR